MSKVSIGLRGWRFDEDAVFTDDGQWKPLTEMDEETRERVLRLPKLATAPCDACYLIYGDEEIARCRVATVVYGEPMAEVVVCDEHEPDFLYWFREAGGHEYAGEDAFKDEFHEWFADGGRAPDGYRGMEYVDTEPADVPEPDLPDEYGDDEERERPAPESGTESGDDADDEVSLDDVDLSADYPT